MWQLREEKSSLAFAEGALLKEMDIAVVESERRKRDYFKDSFVVYLVESRSFDKPIGYDLSCAIWRRYSEFELLHSYLSAIYPFVVVPPLPEKRVNVARFKLTFDKFDPDFIDRRRQGLECFLLRAASHPVFSQDLIFRGFLTQTEGWKECVASTKWKLNVDNRVANLNALLMVKRTDSRFSKIKSYAEGLNANISAVLKIDHRLCNKSLATMKKVLEMGVVLGEWGAIETDFGVHLQRAGSEMNQLSLQISALVDTEEEAYMDQLKEYSFFTDGVKSIVKKQNILQNKLEKAEESISIKGKQKEELITEIQALEEEKEFPSTNLKLAQALIFGAETLERKKEKLVMVEEELKENESMLAEASDKVETFNEKSLEDLERFNKQKLRDISVVVDNYAQTQIKINKISVDKWKTIKEHLMKI